MKPMALVSSRDETQECKCIRFVARVGTMGTVVPLSAIIIIGVKVTISQFQLDD